MLHNEHSDNGADDLQSDDSGAEEKGEAAPPALATLSLLCVVPPESSSSRMSPHTLETNSPLAHDDFNK